MRIAKALLTGAAAMLLLTGCGGEDDTISVISREDGSGTRGAFTELMGITVGGIDNTMSKAEISNSTAVVIQSVAGYRNAVGYISLGSLGGDVKTVSIDGVEASAENIINGTYKASRPFNIATKEDISDLASDFVTYIMSDEGQAVVEEEGFIAASDNGEYSSSGMEGTIVVAGSTSVAPVIEALAEEYKKLNIGVRIEIQQTGSSAGMTSTIEGACDIGMASRELTESELSQGLTSTVIAMDGIAVIVNKENDIENLSSEQIRDIYTGEITSWAEVE